MASAGACSRHEAQAHRTRYLPEVQAEGIVKQFNWYPGIDAEHIQAAIDEATWQKLFADVTPEDLASKGRPFPIGPYFDDILEAYEKQVEN